MSEVVRVRDPNIGPLDGVCLEAKCAITRFSIGKNKVAAIKSQEMADCNIKASMGLGILPRPSPDGQHPHRRGHGRPEGSG